VVNCLLLTWSIQRHPFASPAASVRIYISENIELLGFLLMPLENVYLEQFVALAGLSAQGAFRDELIHFQLAVRGQLMDGD